MEAWIGDGGTQLSGPFCLPLGHTFLISERKHTCKIRLKTDFGNAVLSDIFKFEPVASPVSPPPGGALTGVGILHTLALNGAFPQATPSSFLALSASWRFILNFNLTPMPPSPPAPLPLWGEGRILDSFSPLPPWERGVRGVRVTVFAKTACSLFLLSLPLGRYF